MNATQQRKVLFFIAGVSPTVAEQALIDRIAGQVGVRSVLQSTLYGTRAESCDVVAKGAGVTIPAAYSAKTDVTPYGTGTPAQDAVVSNGQAVTGVTVTGTGTTATFTVVNNVITAIALS